VTTSVSGLVSGLDTQTIVSQLMQVEAAGQTRLKSKVTNEEKSVTAYQSVNTRLAAAKTAADDLGKLSTWRSAKATSTSSTVSAATTNSNTTQTGAVTFDVVSLAKTQVTTTRAAETGDATSQSIVSIAKGDGTTADIDISADRSLAGIASAINDAAFGVKATVVALNDGSGQSVLQMSSSKAGLENGFTINAGFDGDVKTPTAASDARLQVGGPDADGGYSVSSSNNTFSGLITGTSITVTKEGETGVTVDVSSDTSAVTAKMKALVDTMNSALSEIGKQTAFNPGSKSSAALSGDFSVRQISQRLLSTVSNGLDNFGSLSKLGISLTRDGTLSFDETKFASTYTADPDAVKNAATAFGTKVKGLSDASQTQITDVINGRKSLIDTMNDQISNWDIRLATRKDSLTRQFSSMETSLSSMKNQSNWLAGQLANL
jgi:flagellar hook-associated protein 2